MKRPQLNALLAAFGSIPEDPPQHDRDRGGVVAVLNIPRFWLQEDNCSSM